MDLYKKNRAYSGTVDDELEDLISDLTEDDFSFCVDMNGDKQCYDGRDGFKQAYRKYIAMKTFDHTDFSKSVSKMDDNLYEIVCTATYEDDDGTCQKSVETDLIRFAGNKIKSIDTTAVMYDDSNNCKKK